MAHMIRLAARCAVWFAPLYFILSGLALLIGPRLPPRESELGNLGFEACRLPCWAGITPGLTPFAQANRLMAEYLPNFSVPTFLTTSNLTFQSITSEPAIAGTLYYDEAGVSEIHLDVSLPVWYLLDTLGAPDCVWLSSASGPTVMSIYWEKNNLSIAALLIFEGRTAWTLEMPTHFLQMTTNLSCGVAGMLPWMGFAPAWRYWELASDVQ